MFFNRVDQLWNADRLRDQWTSLQSLLFGSAAAIARPSDFVMAASLL